MKILHCDSISNPSDLGGLERNAYYNGHDTMFPFEILEHQTAMLDPIDQQCYEFTFALQFVALRMMKRGILIDKNERYCKIRELELVVTQLKDICNTYGHVLWGAPFNPASYPQKSKLLYEVLKLPPKKKYDKKTGKTRMTTERPALEALSKDDLRAQPLIKAILDYQDANKALGILRTQIDSDGRMRSTYKVAGTGTARMASEKNVRGSGTNAQNFRNSWRTIFTTAEGPMPDRDYFNIPPEYRNLPPID